MADKDSEGFGGSIGPMPGHTSGPASKISGGSAPPGGARSPRSSTSGDRGVGLPEEQKGEPAGVFTPKGWSDEEAK